MANDDSELQENALNEAGNIKKVRERLQSSIKKIKEAEKLFQNILSKNS